MARRLLRLDVHVDDNGFFAVNVRESGRKWNGRRGWIWRHGSTGRPEAMGQAVESATRSIIRALVEQPRKKHPTIREDAPKNPPMSWW